MTSSPGQAAACARYEQQRTPLFSLGTVLITPGALDMLEALQLAPLPFVLRHVAGDWGDLCQEDKQANAAALTYGSRLLSAYDIPPNHRLWIITEAVSNWDAQGNAPGMQKPTGPVCFHSKPSTLLHLFTHSLKHSRVLEVARETI
mgnify:CR=1 FL=1